MIACGIGVLCLTWMSFVLQFDHVSSFSQGLYWAGLAVTTPILYFALQPLCRVLFLRQKPYLAMDVPLVLIILIGYLYSTYVTLSFPSYHHAYFDSILLILFLVYTSRYLELYCQRRIKALSQNLTLHCGKVVTVIEKGQWVKTSQSNIALHDMLYIAPGEYFPVDGIICDGDTCVDESLLTGEAYAIPKFSQERVRAGTYNLDKGVIIQATSTFEDSYLARSLCLTQSHYTYKYQDSLPNEQFGLWHQIIAFSIAIAIFCWWVPFDTHFALLCLVCTLLIVCPCAIMMAYPLTVARVLEVCAHHHLLIKNPAAFFKLADVDHVMFDKTGTLTEGQLVVTKMECLQDKKEEEILPLIAAIEQHTHHRIAQAITDYAQRKMGFLASRELNHLRIFPNKGIRALVNGQFVFIGSAQWLKKNGIFIAPDIIEAQESVLHTSDTLFVHCAIGGTEVARIQLKDSIRHEASSLILYLKQHDIDSTVLSGDSSAIVNIVAKQIGTPSITAEALPQKKEAQIAVSQNQGKITAMIGDGLNDTLALRRADIGIAMGCGDPIALYSADIVLKTPDLSLIRQCYELSQKARAIVKQNYLLALCCNITFLPFAAMGHLNPLGILMGLSLGALLIVMNSTRFR